MNPHYDTLFITPQGVLLRTAYRASSLRLSPFATGCHRSFPPLGCSQSFVSGSRGFDAVLYHVEYGGEAASVPCARPIISMWFRWLLYLPPR